MKLPPLMQVPATAELLTAVDAALKAYDIPPVELLSLRVQLLTALFRHERAA